MTDIIEEHNSKLKQLVVSMEVNIDFQQQGNKAMDYRIKVSNKKTGKYLYTKIFADYNDVLRHLKTMTKKGNL